MSVDIYPLGGSAVGLVVGSEATAFSSLSFRLVPIITDIEWVNV